jgi:hypothetical protein
VNCCSLTQVLVLNIAIFIGTIEEYLDTLYEIGLISKEAVHLWLKDVPNTPEKQEALAQLSDWIEPFRDSLHSNNTSSKNKRRDEDEDDDDSD